jgi:hypothetical protein
MSASSKLSKLAYFLSAAGLACFRCFVLVCLTLRREGGASVEGRFRAILATADATTIACTAGVLANEDTLLEFGVRAVPGVPSHILG